MNLAQLIKAWLICILLAALITAITIIAWVAIRVPEIVERELQETRTMLQGEVRETRSVLDARMASIEQRAFAEIGDLQRLLDNRLTSIESRADAQLTALREDANMHLTRLETEIAGMTAQATPIMENVASTVAELDALIGHTDRAVQLLTPQALGLVAAAKVTAGTTAQTMRTIEKETSTIVANVSQTTANVAQVTKPARWYVRIARILIPVFGGWVIGKSN